MRIVLALLLILPFVACNQPQSPDQIREKTANATAAVKADTKAVADGLKEGLGKNTSVNINSATKDELMKLPGVTDARADRIMAARPYDTTDELVSKKVLTKGEYDQIANRITAKKM
ncbi:ComEA family DNA-binding protein [Candidatus Korobacter versatilis]|nr:helix-hairpin-helix domain-containing protein [Candidatus Koribacter versatilis]